MIEGRGVFSEMTVRENIELGAYSKPGLRGALLQSAIDEAVSMFPRLGDRFDQLAGTLSGGEQQMLAIARDRLARRACWFWTSRPSVSLRASWTRLPNGWFSLPENPE